MTLIRKVLLTFGLCFLLSVPAYAHTQLSESTPTNEAVLDQAPEEIVLTFSEAVRLTAVEIDFGEDSRALDMDSTEPATDFSVGLPDLVPGEYVVQWRALSEDAHVISGEIRFTIAA